MLRSAPDPATAPDTAPFSPSDIKDLMWRAAEYQLKSQARDEMTSAGDINFEWVRGVYYTGVMGAYEATNDPRYLEAALKWGASKDWKPDPIDTRHADWQCCGQPYLECYLLKQDPRMLEGIKGNVDLQMSAPKSGREDWWWCDALYMAPPLLARLHAATGEEKYLDFLNAMFWDSHAFLYDTDEQLFFRDKNYFDARTRGGKKVFWSRGNGWVLGGLARVLQYLPSGHRSRAKYEQLFQEMSGKVAELQPEDGLWRPSLLDAEEFATGETSGTAFFTFALAWGINNGLLAREGYEQVVRKGWKGLVGAITPAGRMTYVQGVAAAPGPVNPNDTREYAVGAFLLAGSELLKLIGNENTMGAAA